MRVALLTNFIPPYRVPLYEALMRAAGELRVFVSTDMEANRQWQPARGQLDVVRQRTLTLPTRWRTASFSEKHELHVPLDTWSQLARWQPDVILSGELGARSAQAVAFARRRGIPVVLWAMLADRLEHGRGRVRTALRRRLVEHAAAIIVNGESGARYFRRLGVTDDRLVRVHQAVDMAALLALPLEREPADALRLLHVGTISERKGVHFLVDGVAEWARDNPASKVQLTLVGAGPLQERLALRRLPANLAARWTGSVPYEDLPRWYAGADALLFPSLGDEWGLVVNEALAAGVPVAGSAYSQAVEELVRDSANGWIFLPEDAAAVAEVVERIAADHSRLGELRHAAREGVRSLTPERTARRIADVLAAAREAGREAVIA